jgi:nicotinate-nucleotide pyrophosphorylase (carboxylating)
MRMQRSIWMQAVERALAEDVGPGDATTCALVPAAARARARIVAREPMIVCGHAAARETFRQLPPPARYRALIADGRPARAGEVVAEISGAARTLLTGERVALNFLQQLSGIATLTRRFVDRAGPKVMMLDTRKTTPGLRALEKYAVRCGGGVNHRFGLYDRVMIKDNHRAFWAGAGSGRLADAVRAARQACPRLEIEVEADTEAELADAMEARPDWVLLDNMSPAQLRRCVRRVGGRAKIEASGGVTLATVAAIARSGVDAISVGALTHSAPACDLSMEFLDAPAR